MDALPDQGFSLGRSERQRIRSGAFTGPTSGLAPGNVQANLVVLPLALANDFLRFAQANPKPCPVLAVSEPGDPTFPTLARDLDIRSDLPRYRVWRNGELAEEPTDVKHAWREDLVSFAIGCSFSFEEALIEDGNRGSSYRLRSQRPDVPYLDPVRIGWRIPRPTGRLHASAEASRCDTCGADHVAISFGAWRSGTPGHAGNDRDHEHR